MKNEEENKGQIQSQSIDVTSDSRDSETGWDRLKSLVKVRYGDPLPEDLKDFPTIVLTASVVGFLFGGMIGSRHAGDKYIAINHHSKFTSTMQAQRELHSAAMLGFVRHGCRWGWKMGLFAGIFSGATVLLTTYRDKEDGLNYIAAGGVTGGIYRLRMGLMPAIGGTVLGLLISFPVGVTFQGLDMLFVGREERTKMRQRLYETRKERERLWKQKLDVTSVIIEGMEDKGLKNYYDLNCDTKTKDRVIEPSTSTANTVSTVSTVSTKDT